MSTNVQRTALEILATAGIEAPKEQVTAAHRPQIVLDRSYPWTRDDLADLRDVAVRMRSVPATATAASELLQQVDSVCAAGEKDDNA